MKSIIKILLGLFFLLPCIGWSSTPPSQEKLNKMVDQVKKLANDELIVFFDGKEYYQPQNVKGYGLNGETFYFYRTLCYGERHGTYDDEMGRYRYLGYNMLGENYTDVGFRPDFSGQLQIDEADWIKDPRKDPYVNKFVTNVMGEKSELKENPFNYNPAYRALLVKGLKNLTTLKQSYYKFNPENNRIQDWENYVHIIDPPTKYTMGTGRMFRWVNGSIRYMDVPLVPFIDLVIDFSVTLKEDSFQSEPGKEIETTATFELNKECYHPERGIPRIFMSINGVETELPFSFKDPTITTDSDGSIEFNPGDMFEARFKFIIPDSPGAVIISRIIPKPYAMNREDADPSNNEDRAPIIIGNYDVKVQVRPEGGSCKVLNGGTTGVNYIIRVTRKDDLPREINATGYINGPAGRFPINVTLGPGENRETKYGFPASPGSYTVEVEAWPVASDDAIPEDNRDSATVTVENQVFNPDSKIRVDLIDGGPIYR